MEHQIRVALADDHTLVRMAIADMIRKNAHFNVVADAEHGKALIDKIALLSSPPDICVLDISMPVYDGYHTIVALKKSYASMKFLVLSLCETEYAVIRMIKSGANGYLTKNCTPENLHEAISSIAATGFYYSSVASEKAFKVVRGNKVTELSEREEEFLRYCCSDLTYAAIAKIMNASIRTIEQYQQKIGEKLHLHSRISLALFAVQSGIVSLNHKIRD